MSTITASSAASDYISLDEAFMTDGSSWRSLYAYGPADLQFFLRWVDAA